MTCLIQHFEADFLWKVSLKILISGIILKTFTHAYIPVCCIAGLQNAATNLDPVQICLNNFDVFPGIKKIVL